MENNPKKSKALIITIIAVLLLGVAIYFMFKNKEQLFGIKASENIDKAFAPLLGTSKPKNVNIIDNSGGGTTGSGVNGTGTGTGIGTGTIGGGLSGTGTGIGIGTGTGTIGGGLSGTGTGTGIIGGILNGTGLLGEYIPPLTPIPTPNTLNSFNPSNSPTVTLTSSATSLPKTGGDITLTWTTTNSPTSCTASGGTFTGAKDVKGSSQIISGITKTTNFALACKNKDGSGQAVVFVTIDPNFDPVCFNPYGDVMDCPITTPTDKTNNEIKYNDPLPPVEVPLCPDDPLYFTKSEHKKLLLLLKQFYLIAPTLKTDDDVKAVITDMEQKNATIEQAKELTLECEAEKANPAYTGPQAVEGNPYYSTWSNQYQTNRFTGLTPDDKGYLPDQTSEWFAKTYKDAAEDYSKFEMMFYIW